MPGHSNLCRQDNNKKESPLFGEVGCAVISIAFSHCSAIERRERERERERNKTKEDCSY